MAFVWHNWGACLLALRTMLHHSKMLCMYASDALCYLSKKKVLQADELLTGTVERYKENLYKGQQYRISLKQFKHNASSTCMRTFKQSTISMLLYRNCESDSECTQEYWGECTSQRVSRFSWMHNAILMHYVQVSRVRVAATHSTFHTPHGQSFLAIEAFESDIQQV